MSLLPVRYWHINRIDIIQIESSVTLYDAAKSQAHLFCIDCTWYVVTLNESNGVLLNFELTGEPTFVVTNNLIGWFEKYFAIFLQSLVQIMEDDVKVYFWVRSVVCIII